MQHLCKQLLLCKACPAYREAILPVAPRGPVSKVMVVGRNPGYTEDINHIPFHPEAPGGSELVWYLAQAGIDHNKLFITNCVNCHTWHDREPKDNEVYTCTEHWLKPFIANIKPKIIIATGRIGVNFFIPAMREVSLMSNHSWPHRTQYGVVWPMPHPAVICYDEAKRNMMKESAKLLHSLMQSYERKFNDQLGVWL